ncbi:MAG: DNA integrity scanning diadenylate cyclase DisA [Acidimicrobiia bacterium]
MNSIPTVPLDLVRQFAPGTPLRTAAELVMRQGTGALVLIGSGPIVDEVSSGGFRLKDTAFTAQRLAELAKMDGGIVVDDRSGSILAANVHFIPDPSLRTVETGTRFRTAERLAQQTGFPVLAVSEEGHLVAVVYSESSRFALQSVTDLLGESNQRLQSIERLRHQFDESVERLSRYEADNLVSMREVIGVIQRAAVIRDLASALDTIAVELGDSASLITLQADDLTRGVAEIAEVVNLDYQRRKPRRGTSVFKKIDLLDRDDLYDAEALADALGFGALDDHAQPRGMRAIAGVPRIPDSVADAILRKFSSYDRLMNATVDDLAKVDGVGPARAQTIRGYLNQVSNAGVIAGE